MDTLSDVLRAVRLTGAYFFSIEAQTPWSAASVPAAALVPRVLPEADHLISYHVLTRGECWGGLMDEPQRHMTAGDVIVFPHGDPHVMASARGLRCADDVVAASVARFPAVTRLGPGPDSDATLVCGFLGCDAKPFNPLLASLPRCMVVPGVARGWLEQFPRQVLAESAPGRVGSDTMLTRMAELMFIEVLRHHIESLPSEQTGWLAGLRDPIVSAALERLHQKPAHAWSLAELASAVGASRSVLVERFTRVIGMPPMQYLTQWRLQLAAEQLLRSGAKVASVAREVGYDSEAAFSRAFKRATGRSPAMWRAERLRASEVEDQ